MNVGSKIGKTGDYRASARVARKFCGRLAISKLAIFGCFAGTNFYESANFVFLGNFCGFRKVPSTVSIDNIFVFVES